MIYWIFYFIFCLAAGMGIAYAFPDIGVRRCLALNMAIMCYALAVCMMDAYWQKKTTKNKE